LAFLLPFWGQAVEWGTDFVLEACQQDCKEKNELAEIGKLPQKGVAGKNTMMREEDRKLAQEFARRVRALFPDAAIWVFGSRARSDATGESDLDCLVVLNDPTPQVDSVIRDIAWELGFENGLVITTVILGREEFERGPMSQSTLIANVLAEGAEV